MAEEQEEEDEWWTEQYYYRRRDPYWKNDSDYDWTARVATLPWPIDKATWATAVSEDVVFAIVESCADRISPCNWFLAIPTVLETEDQGSRVVGNLQSRNSGRFISRTIISLGKRSPDEGYSV